LYVIPDEGKVIWFCCIPELTNTYYDAILKIVNTDCRDQFREDLENENKKLKKKVKKLKKKLKEKEEYDIIS
jgi:bifunctional pyridoxal-dependent enzyme with beta-cystathionase and maltose regulon repressor activities